MGAGIRWNRPDFNQEFAKQAPDVLYGLFMNVLFETYGSSYRIGVERFRFSNGKPRQEVRMAATALMTMLCLAGVAFCVRFLVALGKECKTRSTSLLAAPAYRLKPRGNPATAGTQ